MMFAAIYARMLIAKLGLLALASSASAECAWVHWYREGTPWQLVAAYPSAAECIKHLDKLD